MMGMALKNAKKRMQHNVLPLKNTRAGTSAKAKTSLRSVSCKAKKVQPQASKPGNTENDKNMTQVMARQTTMFLPIMPGLG